jgi:hypothetical protein
MELEFTAVDMTRGPLDMVPALRYSVPAHEFQEFEDREMWMSFAREKCPWLSAPVQKKCVQRVDRILDAARAACADSGIEFLSIRPITQTFAVDLIEVRELRALVENDATVYITEQAYEFACRGGDLMVYHCLTPSRLSAFVAALRVQLRPRGIRVRHDGRDAGAPVRVQTR